jgi:exocyst complex component 1
VDKVELQFESPLLGDGLDVREKVNEAYEKISKSMFDSLQAIAKDTTSHHASGNKDDDDKEQLNSHISMIENMHYYRETVADRGNSMLVKFKANAQSLFDEHLGMYLKIIIRRPLGRLLVIPCPLARLIIGFLARCGNIRTIKSI